MPKFTFVCEHQSGEKITFETDKENIYEVIEDIDMFLHGAGFRYDGVLDIVREEDYDKTSLTFYP
jgi:hypothetical protein